MAEELPCIIIEEDINDVSTHRHRKVQIIGHTLAECYEYLQKVEAAPPAKADNGYKLLSETWRGVVSE